jgi:hypothetical protein
MTSLPLAHVARRVGPGAAGRIARSCSHVAIPAEPAAAGYRYLDPGGDEPPFYVKRMAIDDRSAAVTLRAPIELSGGHEAERGAPALARCELTLGMRRIPWRDVLIFEVLPGESSILAQRAMDEIAALELVDAAVCPICG